MITSGILNGHSVVWLENESLRLAVLPEKGADIPLIYHQRSGVQFLMQTPAGLQPPSEKGPEDFLENYEGGWQELFPNANDACELDGESIPFHGEAALLPWEYETLDGETLYLWVDCRQTPFRLERWMKLEGDRLDIRGRVANLGERAWPFVWGHHIVLGGDFLGEGCRLQMPAKTIVTPSELFEPATARLAENQWESWPFARGRLCGETFDLRQIPGPQAHSHDDAFVTGLAAGHLDVTNPHLRLRFHLDWEAELFPWVVLWQPFGGADLPPLTGIYGLGVEPWVSRYNLAGALAAGQAKSLDPGQTLTTELAVRIEQF